MHLRKLFFVCGNLIKTRSRPVTIMLLVLLVSGCPNQQMVSVAGNGSSQEDGGREVSGVRPSPSSWKEYTELEDDPYGTGRCGPKEPIAVPTSIIERYPDIFPLPDNMKWRIESPDGTSDVPLDVTHFYNPTEGYLILPPQGELGLKYITWDWEDPRFGRKPQREYYNPQVTSNYKVVGEGVLDDGTGIRIRSYIVTFGP